MRTLLGFTSKRTVTTGSDDRVCLLFDRPKRAIVGLGRRQPRFVIHPFVLRIGPASLLGCAPERRANRI